MRQLHLFTRQLSTRPIEAGCTGLSRPSCGPLAIIVTSRAETITQARVMRTARTKAKRPPVPKSC